MNESLGARFRNEYRLFGSLRNKTPSEFFKERRFLEPVW
jgi:hypothetical protein